MKSLSQIQKENADIKLQKAQRDRRAEALEIQRIGAVASNAIRKHSKSSKSKT